MAKIYYKISKDMEKIYEGGVFVRIKFTGEFLFEELTFAERLLLELPLRRDNPDFDNTKPADNDNSPKVDVTEDDTTEILMYSANMAPFNGLSEAEQGMTEEEAIKYRIKKRFEKYKNQYEEKLLTISKESIVVATDDDFVKDLPTMDDIKPEEDPKVGEL